MTKTHTLKYSIRLIIRTPSLLVEEITKNLEISPTYFWNVADHNRKDTAWSLVTSTDGSRYFFREIEQVLIWLDSKRNFIQKITADAGTVTLIAELTSNINIGDQLSVEAMSLAASLGVSIGVEYFPS
jgi:hypothetical protein